MNDKINSAEKQIELLTDIIKLLVEQLPVHAADCGIFRAHVSYGDRYCSCNNQRLREYIRSKLV